MNTLFQYQNQHGVIITERKGYDEDPSTNHVVGRNNPDSGTQNSNKSGRRKKKTVKKFYEHPLCQLLSATDLSEKLLLLREDHVRKGWRCEM